MSIPILITTITLVALSLGTSNNGSASLISPTSSRGRLGPGLSPRLQRVAGQVATRFSSGYTALTKCGSGMTKKEEKEAEEHGSDIPTRCKGYGGYDIYISYSACASVIRAENGAESIVLASQAVDWKQKTVEWRMAHDKAKAKPFAVIFRVYRYAGDEQCATGGKITGESLVIKGLKGFEHIDETVEVETTPNANAKAREIADQGYRLIK